MMKNTLMLSFLCVVITSGLSSTALGENPSFKPYEIEFGYGQMLFCDFDGNGLDDLIGIDDPNLVFFFQDPKKGFAKTPDLIYTPKDTPAIVWHAKLGKKAAQDILMMTHEGVSTLMYAGKTQPPQTNKIIDCRTMLPATCSEGPSIVLCTMSANTSNEYPLIFVPTEDTLQVWKHDAQWEYGYALPGMVDTNVWSSGSAYTRARKLEINISDLNGDQQDDFVVSRNSNEKKTFDLYYQNNEGDFSSRLSKSFDKREWGWQQWACFQDINNDGRVDIIKNHWLQEPGFIPGADSGKVIVEMFLADQDGAVPDESQYIFRKSDWTPSMPVVDIDNDGCIDLVLGYGQFDSREGIRKAITSKKLDHTLRFHFYSEDGYKPEPDFETRISVHLGYRGPIFTSRNSRVERRISLAGDFNGDGLRDLLVKDKKDTISVYFFISRTKGFSKRASIQFNDVDQGRNPVIRDLNNDRISDLVVYNRMKDTQKIFFSKRK